MGEWEDRAAKAMLFDPFRGPPASLGPMAEVKEISAQSHGAFITTAEGESKTLAWEVTAGDEIVALFIGPNAVRNARLFAEVLGVFAGYAAPKPCDRCGSTADVQAFLSGEKWCSRCLREKGIE